MQPKQGRAQQSGMLRERDPDRFYCPFPNCTRSFAELWRLKVHYRAPPDARGSGKERGHGCELQFCPKCSKELKAGKHHVGCFAGKAGARQAAKRVKIQEEYNHANAAVEVEFHRRRSAPAGEGWRFLPLVDSSPAALDSCRPNYPASFQSQNRAASSQDSEASQPFEPSQKKRRVVERPGIEDVQLLRVQSTSLADLHLSACAHFSIESCEEPLLAEAQPSTSGSEGTIGGGHLQRTTSAPPLQQQRLLKDCLFDFTNIFDGDGDGLHDSPPPLSKHPNVCHIHATSASDALLELPGFNSLYDDHIMQAMFADLAGQPPPQAQHRRYSSAHAATWDHNDLDTRLDTQVLREPGSLSSPHRAHHRQRGPFTPPLSPVGGDLQLDALLGFSGTSGTCESSPEHSVGQIGGGCGSSASAGGIPQHRGAASGSHTISSGLPPFPPQFDDDMHFIQDARYGWHDKRILAPPEHPYFSLEAYPAHAKHISLEAKGHNVTYMAQPPLSPDDIMHPIDSDSRRWSPLSEQTHALSFHMR